jgi:hypothetical protein
MRLKLWLSAIGLAMLMAMVVDAMFEPLGIETFSWQWFLILVIILAVVIWGFWPNREDKVKVQLILPPGHKVPNKLEMVWFYFQLRIRSLVRLIPFKSGKHNAKE